MRKKKKKSDFFALSPSLENKAVDVSVEEK